MLESIPIPCRGVVSQLSPAGASLLDFEKRDRMKRSGLHSVQVSLFHDWMEKVSHGLSETYWETVQLMHTAADSDVNISA